MAYGDNGPASFVGQERFVGGVAGRSGSGVLQYTGTADATGLKETFASVPGTGTGELRGLRLQGTFASTHEHEDPNFFDYDFEG